MTDSNASAEASLIARYFKPLATDSGAFDLTDDAAILKSSADELVVTTSSSADDFRIAASSVSPKAPGSVASGLK